MGWLDILYATIAGLIGGGGLTFFLFYKQNKRMKTAEATAKEVEVLQGLVGTLRDEITRLQEKQKSLEERLTDKDGIISLLYRKLDEEDRKYHIKKQAINCAISCEVANNNCPVLLKIAELEK